MFSRDDDEIKYAAVQDNRTSPVKGVLGNLNDELESVVHIITKLEERLSGVINNHPRAERPPGEGAVELEPGLDRGNSPLVQEVSTLIKIVRGQRDRLGSIIDKLDL